MKNLLSIVAVSAAALTLTACASGTIDDESQYSVPYTESRTASHGTKVKAKPVKMKKVERVFREVQSK